MSTHFPYPTAQKYLGDEGYTLKVSNDKIRVNGSRAQALDVLFKKELDSSLSEICREKGDTSYLMMRLEEKQKWIRGFYNYLVEQDLEQRKEEAPKLSTCVGDLQLINPLDTGELCLYNTRLERLVSNEDRSIKSFKNQFKQKEWEEVKTMAPPVARVFEPEVQKQSWYADFKGETYQEANILHVQKYALPKWFLETKAADFPNELPPIYKYFIECLIPDPKERHIYFSWKRNALRGTNNSVLILSGLSSTGKSVEMNSAQPALIGKDASKAAPHEFASSRFNYILDSSRLLCFDEIGLEKKSEVANFKRMINKLQVLNKKGVEAEHNTEIRCNYMISCNDLPFNIRPTERKFQFIAITNKRLLTQMSKEKVTRLVYLLENDLEFQAQIGWYFFNYDTKISPFDDAIKGPKFWEVLFRSLRISFPYAASLYDILRNMKQGETIEESRLAKKVSEASSKYAKTKIIPASIVNWNEELKLENRAIFERFVEDDTKMVRSLIGAEDLDLDLL